MQFILRCAHDPNLAKGVVCGHKNWIGSYGDKYRVDLYENRVGLQHFGIQVYVSTYQVV